MRAVFSGHGQLQGMLDFEAGLARAEGRCGVIPVDAVTAICAECHAEYFDSDELAKASAQAGNVAIPLVAALTARVAALDVRAANYVHWGATSQDMLDTGLMLQLQRALGLIRQDAARLSDALVVLAKAHRMTVMAGRTWLQQSTPITFGLKVAGWLDTLGRHQQRLRNLEDILALQLGGASGTLASLGKQGLEVCEILSDEIGLAQPSLPWHTERDRVVEFATTYGLLVGTLGKMARDISLLMQTEIAEACEPYSPGRGGSSSMPQKRNPVACAVVLAAAVRMPGLVATLLSAMVQEHERGLGGWHAEWETLPELCRLTAGALAQMVDVISGLEVFTDRMRDNLGRAHGLVTAESVSLALADHLGRSQAHRLVQKASESALETGQDFVAVLAAAPEVARHFSRTEIDRLLSPSNYLGSTAEMIESVLERVHAQKNIER